MNQPPVKAPTLSILDQVRMDPNFTTRRSVDWFKKKINDLGGNSPSAKQNLLNETKDQQSSVALPGVMHFFRYDPKFKEELPFYDMFPLSFIFSVEGGLMRGINFHYLPFMVRARL